MQTRGIVFNVQKFCVHDGPGIRTTVFLKGCPLRCPWCANPESQLTRIQTGLDKTRYGEERTVASILEEVLEDRPFYEESGGGATLSGGEPLMQFAFALRLLRALRDARIHTAVETTGAVSAGRFALAAKEVDVFLFDVKHYDARRHERATGMSNRRILDNLGQALDAGKEVVARIPIIPGFNDSLEDARSFCRLLRALGVRRADLLPFHQFGERKYALLGKSYAYADVPALTESALADYREIFCQAGLIAAED